MERFDAPPEQKLILAALADAADRRGLCRVDVPELAAYTGMPTGFAQIAVECLIRDGVLIPVAGPWYTINLASLFPELENPGVMS